MEGVFMEKYIFYVALFFLIMSIVVKIFEGRFYSSSTSRNELALRIIKIGIMLFFSIHSAAFGWWLNNHVNINLIPYTFVEKMFLAGIFYCLAIANYTIIEQREENRRPRKLEQLKNC